MAGSRHITDYLREHAHKTPDKLALVSQERNFTWAELWQATISGANFLDKQLDSSRQQTVALLMPNTWQYVVAYLSIIHAGHMALPIDVIFKPLEIKAVIHQASPALIITDEAGRSRLPKNGAPVFEVKDLTAKPAVLVSNDFLRLPAQKQIASLLFTSGTTGKPKIVPNTHLNHIWNIETCSKVWRWNGEDSQLVSTRLSHMLGLILGLSGTLYHGNTLYLQDKFDEKTTLELLASGRVTMFSHGPQVYARLLELSNHAKYDLSGVRLFISGSGPLPPAIWHGFKEVFGAEIMEVYGTTETGRIASNLLHERIPGSPGRPLPGVEIKFDKHSEVLVKSDGVFPGYLNNAEATAKARTADGFWRTGDIGELVDGRLVLKGRLAERIRKFGYSVSPRDVEWALHQDKRIKEVLVMGKQQSGRPDDEIIYFIVGDITESQIHKFCAANLPSVWRPSKIIILDKLPRTRMGKPQLATLRAMLN